jgi:hypothetical protein
MLTTGSSFLLHPTMTAPTQPQPAAKHRFSFGDLLDIVNPLQHLPVIGTLYRAVTGDEIGTPEKLVGDAIYGGPWGLVSSLADTAFESATGRNFGDTVLSLVTGKPDDKPVALATHEQAPTDITRQPMPVAQTGIAAAPQSKPVTVASATPEEASPARNDTAERALYAYRRSLHAQHPSAFGMF